MDSAVDDVWFWRWSWRTNLITTLFFWQKCCMNCVIAFFVKMLLQKTWKTSFGTCVCVYFGILISTVAFTNMSMSGGLLIALSIPTSYMHHWLCLCIQILCQHFSFQIAVFVHYASIFVLVVIVWLVYCCVQPMQETVLLMEDILIDYITDTVCALVFFSCWTMSTFLFSCWYISAECHAFMPLPNWICASANSETFVSIWWQWLASLLLPGLFSIVAWMFLQSSQFDFISVVCGHAGP